MRRAREILRLHHEHGLSPRLIARSCAVSKNSVYRCLERAKAAGLGWPLPETLDDRELEAMLYPKPEPPTSRPQPDWEAVERELQYRGMTRRQVWLEYREVHPNGYNYSWFCEQLKRRRAGSEPRMRQTQTAGEVAFIDYAGMTLPITDPKTGEIDPAQVFVAVLGASQLIFSEGTATQQKHDWQGSHIRAFEYFGGVPQTLVPDNLKSGVNKAHRYDPDLNIDYTRLAEHYGVAVVPARVRTPRDKSLVENAVLIIEREALAPLRHHTFFSLDEANAALAERLELINNRPMSDGSESRRARFERFERAALRPLPKEPFESSEWRRIKVPADYHIVHAEHAYSVPHRLIGQTVEVRITERVIEILHANQRRASHLRRDGPGKTTVREHMPPAHQAYAELDAEGILRWACAKGDAVEALVRQSLEHNPLRKTRRLAEGLQRLERVYGTAHLGEACAYAHQLGMANYTSLESILRSGLARRGMREGGTSQATPIEHANVRGPAYYH
ncbi:IS21 family transposase [Spiribacter sp. 221]|uniref:IS21 family transposase n=1 Tax=Spiribacter onubensis TaxID=3122420 RepID=UPI00349F3661